MSTDQHWIRTEANFCRIRTGSDCNFLKIGGSGLYRTEESFVVLNSENIKNFSCDPISQVC